MSRSHKQLSAVFAVVLLLPLIADGQESTPPHEIEPVVTLPALGPDRLRVTPQPRVRVTDQDADSVRSHRQDPRVRIDADDLQGLRRQEQQALRRGRTSSPRSSASARRAERSNLVAQSNGSGATMRRAPGQRSEPNTPTLFGRLIVITGFEQIDVTVDGQAYPVGSMQGVLLYAGEEYQVTFEQADQGTSAGRPAANSASGARRVIPVRLRPGETRVLMANLGGEDSARRSSAATRPRSRRDRARERERDDDDDEEIGYLGVSSSPRGMVHVDGDNTGQMTPARRIELDPGRHEVRIFYESEERFSETKNVLIRAGVNTNVFFRFRRDEETEVEDD